MSISSSNSGGHLNQPRVLGHRGASGTRLENTIAAFLEARRLGADGVELDIHATRDGALVVHHDPTLPDLGPIGQSSLADLDRVRLANGEPIPTLEQALGALEGMETWIEVKALPADLDRALLGLIERSPSPERCAVHSFDHRIIARLGRGGPGLRRGVLSASYPLDPVTPMLAAGASVLWQNSHLIDPELVSAIHRRGFELIAWTVNDSGTARHLAALGVDALCGNYPDRLRIH